MRQEREQSPTSISWTHHPFNSPQLFTVPLSGVEHRNSGEWGRERMRRWEGRGETGPLKDSIFTLSLVQFGSVHSLSCVRCNPMDCSTPGFPVHHQLPELAQIQVHRVSDAIQPSHPLSSPSPPAFNLSQHHSLLQGVSSSHQVAKTGVSASASVLPMNIQDWFPLGSLT